MARTREQAPEHIGKDELTTMSALHARLTAAIQQVRTSTPRECGSECYSSTRDEYRPMHSALCDSRWVIRVDARLAACVEVMIREVRTEDPADSTVKRNEAGLAAFLAAAAQKETTK